MIQETFERYGQDVYRLDLTNFTWKLMVEWLYIKEYNITFIPLC